jgi:hypothetical protein
MCPSWQKKPRQNSLWMLGPLDELEKKKARAALRTLIAGHSIKLFFYPTQRELSSEGCIFHHIGAYSQRGAAPSNRYPDPEVSPAI